MQYRHNKDEHVSYSHPKYLLVLSPARSTVSFQFLRRPLPELISLRRVLNPFAPRLGHSNWLVVLSILNFRRHTGP